MKKKIFQVTYTDEYESNLHGVVIAKDKKQAITIFIKATNLHSRTECKAILLGTAKAKSKSCVVCIDESDY